MKIVLASTNKGKLNELKERLKKYNIEVLSLSDLNFNEEIEETGTTFRENALIKAKTIYDKYQINTLADDSGLCVIALDNKPGIYSARYLGLDTPEKRRRKILEQMEGILDRRAYFYCALVYIDQYGVHEFNGQIDGEIGYEEVGDKGFGYDPIFNVNGKSFASIDLKDKNEISHRGKAMKKFEEYLSDLNN